MATWLLEWNNISVHFSHLSQTFFCRISFLLCFPSHRFPVPPLQLLVKADNSTPRFYRDVQVKDTGKGFAVTLDGRYIETPESSIVILPTRALAEAIAVEWDSQHKFIKSTRMPLVITFFFGFVFVFLPFFLAHQLCFGSVL